MALAVKGVETAFLVRLETGQHLQLPVNLRGEPHMGGKYFLDFKRTPVQQSLQLEILAEAHAPEQIGGLPTRKVARCLLKLQQRRTAVHDVHVAELVRYVLQRKRPIGAEVVDLVEEHMRESVLVKVFNQVLDSVSGKPQVVKARIQSLL